MEDKKEEVISVVIRMRPLNNREISQNNKSVWKVLKEHKIIRFFFYFYFFSIL